MSVAALEKDLATLDAEPDEHEARRARREALLSKIEAARREEREVLNREDAQRQAVLAAAHQAVVARLLARFVDLDPDVAALGQYALAYDELGRAISARGGRARPLQPAPVTLGDTSASAIGALVGLARRYGLAAKFGSLSIRR